MSAPQGTGLVCPACRQPVAIIERETDTAITFRCEACGHQWSAVKTVGDQTPDDRRPIAFDSNVLTYFLDANNGRYSRAPDDALADQRIAVFRLFLYGTRVPCIMPTVRREALAHPDPGELDEHRRFMDNNFDRFTPDTSQQASIERRSAELRQHHKGERDCRIVAEVEAHGGILIFVTFDGGQKNRLGLRTHIRLQTPVECWNAFAIPRGTRPTKIPAPEHPVATETWWVWE